MAPWSIVMALTGCNDLAFVQRVVPAGPETDVSVQRVRGGHGPGSAYVGLHVLVTDPSGAAVACDDGKLTLTVEVSTEGPDSGFVPVEETEVTCVDGGVGDLALVLDNSGSEDGFVDELQAGAQALADGVLDGGGRASLTRVSTNAAVLLPVTDAAATFADAIAETYVADGWTALNDGIRMGNETLGGALLGLGGDNTFHDLGSFCEASDRLGVVAFTDGRENNSADQQDYDHDLWPGDGIDTTYDDLFSLSVQGQTTPIYTIGLGNDVDHVGLEALADATGARHLPIDDESEIDGVFDLVADYFDSTTRVCAELPEDSCGPVWIRTTWSWSDGTELTEGVTVDTLHLDCPVDPTGNLAVMLLTMTNPHMTPGVSETLATNTVGWVTPVEDPAVLVVLDDNHHNEFRDDAAWVATVLADAGWQVDYLEEGEGGIDADDIDGYDVVWYSNPGYPPDDQGAIDALGAFAAAGGGVVIQGDDMAWSWGHGFSMAESTHLDFVGNGTSYCGAPTNNNVGEDYDVTFGNDDHPMLAGLQGLSTLYGDDIDTTVARGEGEAVLATATLAGHPECGDVPVVVSWTP